MNEPFILEVNYQNHAYKFPAAFQRYGFTYRIAVAIAETPYIFEPDEEGHYRVLYPTDQKQLLPEPGLLQAIAERLRKL